MIKNNIKKFAIFGDPIEHSKSPIIHKLFSEQFNIKIEYLKIHANINNVISLINNFFINGGNGANVTTPFKQKTLICADKLTKISSLVKSINTLKKKKNNKILGDNTDGVGLLKDLKRLKFIKSNNNILLLGAGGAARGVVLHLLSYESNVYIFNRTLINSQKLLSDFNNFNKIKIINYTDLINIKFNLIINSTSCGLYKKYPKIPYKHIIRKSTFCYDMFYQKEHTPFLKMCAKNGANNLSDGIGMLVYQAAESFYLWNKLKPNVLPVIDYLKKNIN
ncbi:shikimate dehydrogenase [Buchnera aphidicola (Taiwanaphis decaspermi)]|uniref:shikimate dehydrogenase n=1 Tax=Buchnera aphidicola TaxID=9 RepID=UPI0031B82021